jgi:hypothetical protein
MSWYCWIEGEVETSRQARPIIEKHFGPWMEPYAEGIVEVEEKKGSLRLAFSGMYRNLGRHIQGGLYGLAHAHPRKTVGEAHLFSTDGEYCHGALRVADGKVYERTLSEKEEELLPYSFHLGGKTHTLYLTREAIEERKLRDEPRRRDQGGGET